MQPNKGMPPRMCGLFMALILSGRSLEAPSVYVRQEGRCTVTSPDKKKISKRHCRYLKKVALGLSRSQENFILKLCNVYQNY